MIGEKLPLPVLSAFLCLGSKYDFRELNVEARRRLYRTFPATLPEYDLVRLQSIFSGWNEFQESREHSYSLFELLAIARRADLLSILPHLLYDCCKTFSASEILHGPKYPVDVDGAHTKPFPSGRSNRVSRGSSRHWQGPSSNDIRLALRPEHHLYRLHCTYSVLVYDGSQGLHRPDIYSYSASCWIRVLGHKVRAARCGAMPSLHRSCTGPT